MILLSSSTGIESGIAPLCSGDIVELTCTLQAGRVIEWQVNFTQNIPQPLSTGSLVDGLSSNFPAHIVTIHSMVFNFSRISPPNSPQLVSKLTIVPNQTNASSTILNGTLVICSDREMGNSSSTRVNVVKNINLADIVHSEFYDNVIIAIVQ